MTSESERHAIFATSSTVAITTLTPFRGPPSDGPKLILKAPASSWERGSGTPLWNQETLTKGGVWFPLLSSKWIHTVRVRERAWVCVCSCLFMKPCNTPCCHHAPPHQVKWPPNTQPRQLYLHRPNTLLKRLVDNESDNLITLQQFCFHIPDDQEYMFPC